MWGAAASHLASLLPRPSKFDLTLAQARPLLVASTPVAARTGAPGTLHGPCLQGQSPLLRAREANAAPLPARGRGRLRQGSPSPQTPLWRKRGATKRVSAPVPFPPAGPPEAPPCGLHLPLPQPRLLAQRPPPVCSHLPLPGSSRPATPTRCLFCRGFGRGVPGNPKRLSGSLAAHPPHTPVSPGHGWDSGCAWCPGRKQVEGKQARPVYTAQVQGDPGGWAGARWAQEARGGKALAVPRPSHHPGTFPPSPHPWPSAAHVPGGVGTLAETREPRQGPRRGPSDKDLGPINLPDSKYPQHLPDPLPTAASQGPARPPTTCPRLRMAPTACLQWLPCGLSVESTPALPRPSRAWGQSTGGAKVFSEPVGPQVPGDLRGPPCEAPSPWSPRPSRVSAAPRSAGVFSQLLQGQPHPLDGWGPLGEENESLGKMLSYRGSVLKAGPALCFLERGHLGTQEGPVEGHLQA